MGGTTAAVTGAAVGGALGVAAGVAPALAGAAGVVGSLPAVAGLSAAGSVGGAGAGAAAWEAYNPQSHYDHGVAHSKWATPEGRMWRRQIAEAPEWSSPGASPKWRRPSGDMWQADEPHLSSSKPPEDYINTQPRVLQDARPATVTPTLRGPHGEVW